VPARSARAVCDNERDILRRTISRTRPARAAATMPQDPNRLIWIDLEMTGLKPDTDRILEVALVVTDGDLATVAEGPVWVVRQDEATLDAMDAWNQGTHGRSGLVAKVKASFQDEAAVEAQALAFLQEHVPPKASPMCGNSICQDRRFLARWMPALEDYFHYRNLDVSTLKELARRWKPEVLKGVPKEGKHEALADVYESIAELKHYREQFIRS
jgi:oligoribonuclease